jgi:ABC-2 type transport system ATP-binding protein
VTEAIRTEDLTKYYGTHRGLAGLNMEVQAGEVFGFLGPNGAGKTTTIRLLLDLLRPTSGQARVLGLDPRGGGPALRQRLGYLAGDFIVEGNQSVQEFLTFAANLRGGVALARIEALAERLTLDLAARVRSLSKGNKQKVGLVQAFMHQPELLVLDEPTSGLDPLVQQEFLAMVAEARAAGQTVFMSSHVLSEVAHSADRVGIVRDGKVVAVESVERLRERTLPLLEIRFESPVPAEAFAGLPGVHDLALEGNILRCRVKGSHDGIVKAAARYPVASLRTTETNLEEIFFAHYREGGNHAA